jgi:hypothetical protein
MFHVFCTYVASACSKCFIYFRHMLHSIFFRVASVLYCSVGVSRGAGGQRARCAGGAPDGGVGCG